MLSKEKSKEGIMICDLCHNSELSDENVEIFLIFRYGLNIVSFLPKVRKESVSDA